MYQIDPPLTPNTRTRTDSDVKSAFMPWHSLNRSWSAFLRECPRWWKVKELLWIMKINVSLRFNGKRGGRRVIYKKPSQFHEWPLPLRSFIGSAEPRSVVLASSASVVTHMWSYILIFELPRGPAVEDFFKCIAQGCPISSYWEVEKCLFIHFLQPYLHSQGHNPGM